MFVVSFDLTDIIVNFSSKDFFLIIVHIFYKLLLFVQFIIYIYKDNRI